MSNATHTPPANSTCAALLYPAELLSFSHGKFEIFCPLMDESATVHIDPRRYGFSETRTAQGKALRLNVENGHYLLLTDSTGTNTPDLQHPDDSLFSRFSATGELLATCAVRDIP